MMESALFRLNTLTTSDGLCDKQALEEPVGPVSPSGYHSLRNGVEGTLLCQDIGSAPPMLISSPLVPMCLCGALEPRKGGWLCQHP